MGLTGKDFISLSGWFNDLTYEEVHAAQHGAFHALGMMICLWLGFIQGFPLFGDIALGIFGMFVVLNGWCKVESTKDIPFVKHAMKVLPADIRKQIRNELHYYDSAFVAVSMVSGGVIAAVEIIIL